MTTLRYAISVILASLVLTGLLFAASLLKTGERTVAPLENIHGIPYPTQNDAQLITEKLAHADIFLTEPVLAKNLNLTISFEPGNLKQLGVGVRENEFWLSYTPVPLYPNINQTQTITIPLTDKLQEKDRSLDLMFFAEAKNKQPQWEVVSVKATTKHVMPTKAQLKDYLRSIIKKERAL